MNKHAWLLSDLPKVPKNGIKVMSTFACGGGSSIGYKRAGCTVVAANDIDPVMAAHYKRNINPEHYFLCPIGELIGKDLPEALYNLDILDGSPPCSTFSMAGSREKDWGKKKHFREGQASQVLSDLFFDYLNLVGKLRPKVAVAENVKGMLIGKAKGYTKLVMERFVELGYRPQLFLLNAVTCGVPQSRERVFFCAVRNDVSDKKLALNPSHFPVSFGAATDDLQVLTADEIEQTKPTGTDKKFYSLTRKGCFYEEACQIIRGKGSFFNHYREDETKPFATITAQVDKYLHHTEMRKITLREAIRVQSFPDDYIFDGTRIGYYMLGMSVPPKMTEQVARAVCSQWLGVDYD
jgi:DNA (cytosine-5)-methyltransferase 1